MSDNLQSPTDRIESVGDSHIQLRLRDVFRNPSELDHLCGRFIAELLKSLLTSEEFVNIDSYGYGCYIWYSYQCKGGAFCGACDITIHGHEIKVMPFGSSSADVTFADNIKYDIREPAQTIQLGMDLRAILDGLQLDRKRSKL